uniref:Putative conserved plasma membrane protein n=1 Tax=Ixodes ricinus TaxID=34613 RepID=A0A090XBJ5_IXORI
MSGTPQQIVNDDCLNESWVELYYGALVFRPCYAASLRQRPHPGEASAGGPAGLLMSSFGLRRVVGKPPRAPHSPSNEDGTPLYLKKQEEKQIPTDWIWDWSSRPDQQPPKDWKFRHPGVVANRKRPVLSLRGSRIIRLADIFPLLLLSNLLSVLLGAGIGVCIGRRMRVASVE